MLFESFGSSSLLIMTVYSGLLSCLNIFCFYDLLFITHLEFCHVYSDVLEVPTLTFSAFFSCLFFAIFSAPSSIYTVCTLGSVRLLLISFALLLFSFGLPRDISNLIGLISSSVNLLYLMVSLRTLLNLFASIYLHCLCCLLSFSIKYMFIQCNYCLGLVGLYRKHSIHL